MSATIKDVARLAGVSVATVSRVLNGSAPVRDDTRVRVLEVARQLRFAPNGAARALSRRRAGSLGVVLPDLYGEFFSELLRGIDQQAQRAGHSLLVSSSHHDAHGVSVAVRAMRGRVDGLLVMAPEVSGDALDAVLPDGIPVVLLNRAPGLTAESIMVDNYGGAHAMTRHLLALGHRRIGFIAGAEDNADSDERELGYRTALAEAGVSLDDTRYVRGDFTEDGGWRAMLSMLASGPRPTAIFAANDAMAIGALSALRDADLGVPIDVAVVGFDDIPVARFLSPPLTTVRVGIAALGQRAASLLLAALEERAPPDRVPRRGVLPTELVVRSSCGAAFASTTERVNPRAPSNHFPSNRT
jgi:LacI family transcriptional regulator